jgi:hypothetical protein
VDDDVGVPPDGGGEVCVYGDIEGVVQPGGTWGVTSDEVLGLFEEEDDLVVEDVFDALLDFWVIEEGVHLLLN